jgi:predicted nucleic acid-binding Zn ribbon protein
MCYDADDDWEDSSYGDDDSEDYANDAAEEPTRYCPYCGFEMLEICVQCPSCGQYLSKEDVHDRSQPLWVWLTAILCLAAILFWVFLV